MNLSEIIGVLEEESTAVLPVLDRTFPRREELSISVEVRVAARKSSSDLPVARINNASGWIDKRPAAAGRWTRIARWIEFLIAVVPWPMPRGRFFRLLGQSEITSGSRGRVIAQPR